MSRKVDVRCPVGPRRLMLRLIEEGERPRVVPDSNLLELACHDCKRLRRKAGELVSIVYHRYNILGEHIETEVVLESGEFEVLPGTAE